MYIWDDLAVYTEAQIPKLEILQWIKHDIHLSDIYELLDTTLAAATWSSPCQLWRLSLVGQLLWYRR